jgi:hypothetical protein
MTRMRINSSFDTFNPESNMTCPTLSVNLGNPLMVKYQDYAMAVHSVSTKSIILRRLL